MATQVDDASNHPQSSADWHVGVGFDATTEQISPIELPITGVFPACVAGILYRTGPATFRVPDSPFTLTHWFDGFTQLYRFQLTRNPDDPATCKVLFNSRRQVDHLIEKVKETGQLEGITFGQKRDPCDSFFKKVKAVFESTWDKRDASMVNVGVTVHVDVPGVHVGQNNSDSENATRLKTLTTLTDANILKHVDPETLEPLGVTQQEGLHHSLKGPISAAHAAIDPATRDVYNYNLDFGRNATYRIFRTSAQSGKTDILATISGQSVKPAYLHSFFLSTDHVIICVWPCIFSRSGIRLLWERNFVDALHFDSKTQTRWYVVDRKQGKGLVATFLSDAFFSFHTINSFQKDSEDGTVDIFCDVIQYPNDDIIRKTLFENLTSTSVESIEEGVFSASKSSLVRYKLPGIPKSGIPGKTPQKADVVFRIAEEYEACELPAINPRFKTQRARYVYGLVNRKKSSFFDGIVKIDLETNQSTIWEHERHTPSEAIFVPADGMDEAAEDAGYLLSVVLNGDSETSYLICLNARDMTEVGRAEYSAAIAFGLHGSHYPENIMS